MTHPLHSLRKIFRSIDVELEQAELDTDRQRPAETVSSVALRFDFRQCDVGFPRRKRHAACCAAEISRLRQLVGESVHSTATRERSRWEVLVSPFAGWRSYRYAVSGCVSEFYTRELLSPPTEERPETKLFCIVPVGILDEFVPEACSERSRFGCGLALCRHRY